MKTFIQVCTLSFISHHPELDERIYSYWKHTIDKRIVWIVLTHLAVFRYVMIWEFAFDTILVHYPVGFTSFGSSALVEYQRLLPSDQFRWLWTENLSFPSGGFPVSSLCGSVGSKACRILAVPMSEEVPFLLSNFGFRCTCVISEYLQYEIPSFVTIENLCKCY